MTKPTNLVKTILHGAIGLLGVLILGFLGLPYITQAAYSIPAMGVDAPATSMTGYDVLDSNNPNPTTKETFLYVVVLLLVIFACLMIVASVLALLEDFGVVSNAVYGKVVKWALFASVLTVLVLTVLNIVACTGVVAEKNELVDTMNGQLTALGITVPYVKTGLAALVLNVICGAGATTCVGLATFKRD